MSTSLLLAAVLSARQAPRLILRTDLEGNRTRVVQAAVHSMSSACDTLCQLRTEREQGSGPPRRQP